MRHRDRLTRFLTDMRPPGVPPSPSRTDFYREEFVKQQKGLERQREYYSARAISEVETALTRILADLDVLCRKEDADQVMSRLLRQFDIVTGVSAWTDPKNVH